MAPSIQTEVTQKHTNYEAAPYLSGEPDGLGGLGTLGRLGRLGGLGGLDAPGNESRTHRDFKFLDLILFAKNLRRFVCMNCSEI